jgi:internalin A
MVPVPDHPDLIIPYDELRVMEENGVQSFPKVVGNTVVHLVVKDLLNGVEMTATLSAPALRVFNSYSHKDEELRDELATHLSLLKRQGLILPWHDRAITAGEEWKGKIDDALERAEIILLLVSADFLSSDYCYDVELRRAMERHEKGEAHVIPIILRDCSWTSAPFGKLQALPKDGKAVKAWPDRDTAWWNVEQGIAKAVNELQARRSPSL